MAALTDPDYCDHGKHFRERCFFCGREGAKKRGRPRKVALPGEHRNQPAEEPRRANSASRNGGRATAAKKARERGEVAWADL